MWQAADVGPADHCQQTHQHARHCGRRLIRQRKQIITNSLYSGTGTSCVSVEIDVQICALHNEDMQGDTYLEWANFDESTYGDVPEGERSQHKFIWDATFIAKN